MLLARCRAQGTRPKLPTPAPAWRSPLPALRRNSGHVQGDPSAVPYAVDNAKKILGKKPAFGICMGHQVGGLGWLGAWGKRLHGVSTGRLVS